MQGSGVCPPPPPARQPPEVLSLKRPEGPHGMREWPTGQELRVLSQLCLFYPKQKSLPFPMGPVRGLHESSGF